MADLLALDHILVGFREYQPGELLPADHPDAAAWVESGAAKWRGEGSEPTAWPKAKMAAAEPGLPGLAVGGEATGRDLVGKIPATPERMRGKCTRQHSKKF